MFTYFFRGRTENGEADDELTIPRAAMNKMIKEILPNIRVANEVKLFDELELNPISTS